MKKEEVIQTFRVFLGRFLPFPPNPTLPYRSTGARYVR